MRNLPYSTRLAVAYTAIFSIALLAFSFIAFATVHVSLDRQIDTRLATTATAVRSVPDVRRGALVFDEDDRLQFLELLTDNHVNGLTVTMTGRVLLSNLARPPREIMQSVAGTDPHHGNLRIGNDTVAYMAYPIWNNNRQYGSIIVWSSRTLGDDVARTTLVALLAASLLVIVLATVVGGSIIRRMLRPVSDLSAMMSEIEVASLSERLAWDGPDDELGRLCTTFDRLLDRLEAAFERERQFTADASHELRTPVSVMRAEVELALSRERDLPEYQRILERLQREITRLELLVESLLLSARQEAVVVPAALVEVSDVLQRAVNNMLPLMRAQNVDVAIGGLTDASALVNATALERALVALLDNALRFSPAGSTIRLDVARSGGRIAIAIADEGPGFSDAALLDATRRFWRDDPSRSGSGTGLGLSIVCAIIERYDGSVTLANGVPQGAIVTIRLPQASPAMMLS